MSKLEDAQVLVIVNKRDDLLTANLQGPLVVNVDGRMGMQLVLAEKRWNTRHELLRVGEPAAKAVSA
jgi:flagellar assembly factor FliW